MIEAQSIKAWAVIDAIACSTCGSPIREPCRHADGRVKEVRGYLGVCLARMIAAQKVSR